MDEPLRLLHVTPTYLPALRYGGPIRTVHALCRALAALGHDVHVFTTNVDGPDDSAVPLANPVDLEGVKVTYFPSPLLRRLYWSPQMGRALSQEVAGFDDHREDLESPLDDQYGPAHPVRLSGSLAAIAGTNDRAAAQRAIISSGAGHRPRASPAI